jgi:hypothetical protein
MCVVVMRRVQSASNVPIIDESVPRYNCVCMKQCSCTYKKPNWKGVQSKCFCSNPEGGEMIGDVAGEGQMYRDIIEAGKIVKAGKAENCDCVCAGRMDT